MTDRQPEQQRRGPAVWPAFTAVAAVASLPFLSVLAANLDEGIDLATVGTWWTLTLAVALGVLAGATAWRRHAAGPVAVVLAVVLHSTFSFGATTELAAVVGTTMDPVVWWRWVAGGALVVALALCWFRPVQQFVWIVAPLLLLQPVAQLVTAVGSASTTEVVAGDDADVPRFVRTPDVHWIVLDGLAGVPYLRDTLGVDTDDFVAALEEDGFVVPPRAGTNYPLTHLAVSSALEQTLTYEGLDEPPPGPFFEAIRGDNRTVDTFLGNGYDYVHAYPGLWNGSRCGGRETACLGANGTLTDTEVALLSATPLLDTVLDTEAHATVAATNDPADVTATVLRVSGEAPTFAFVHMLNPHPPYLRTADCSVRAVPLDLAAWGEGEEYADAVTCLLDRLELAVERILAQDEDAVIVISGDHGPRLGLSDETRGQVVLEGEQYLSAFAALRLPGDCADTAVPDDLTMVNTFRLVVACLADEEPVLLPDVRFPIRRDYG